MVHGQVVASRPAAQVSVFRAGHRTVRLSTANVEFAGEGTSSASAPPLVPSRPYGASIDALPSGRAVVEAVPTFLGSRHKRCHPNDGTRKPTHSYGWAAALAFRFQHGVARCEPQYRPPQR